MLHKSCSRINARCECNAGRSGDLRSGLARDYSKKLSSKETSLFDEENQAFFTADCGRLQVPFTSPHSLSVNGSSAVAPGKTIRSRSIVLRHKVANTPYITPMASTEYRYYALFAVILGRTQNLTTRFYGIETPAKRRHQRESVSVFKVFIKVQTKWHNC